MNPKEKRPTLGPHLVFANSLWRVGRDSNPRDACAPTGFQDRSNRPLCHPPAMALRANMCQRFAPSRRKAVTPETIGSLVTTKSRTMVPDTPVRPARYPGPIPRCNKRGKPRRNRMTPPGHKTAEFMLVHQLRLGTRRRCKQKQKGFRSPEWSGSTRPPILPSLKQTNMNLRLSLWVRTGILLESAKAEYSCFLR